MLFFGVFSVSHKRKWKEEMRMRDVVWLNGKINTFCAIGCEITLTTCVFNFRTRIQLEFVCIVSKSGRSKIGKANPIKLGAIKRET